MTLCVRRAVARLSAALFLVAVVGCQTESVPRNVEITYRFHEGGCEGCASYELTFRERGIVQFRGLGGCAVHGEHEYRIPPADFATIRNALDVERFFSTRRIAQTGIIIDASVTRITYRDDRRIHETVDYGGNPRLRRLATLLRRAGRAGRFISPTATVYEALLKSSWDPNVPHAADGWTALACAVVQGRADAVRLLLAHGARVRPLDLRIATLHPDVRSILDGSSPIAPESPEAAGM